MATLQVVSSMGFNKGAAESQKPIVESTEICSLGRRDAALAVGIVNQLRQQTNERDEL